VALKGTLRDFPITDIFQLADQQGKSGVLRLTNEGSVVRVLFHDGKVVGAEAAGGKSKEPLGAMLLRAGLITEEGLTRALKVQKKTLRKLGHILVSEGVLSREDLQHFLALQTQETIYRLFLWRNGEYEFLSERPEYEEDLATPQSAQHLVMDSLRMIDEWPGVRRQIQGLDAIPARVEGAESRIRSAGGAADEDLDGDLDAAFSEWGEDDDQGPAPESQSNMVELSPRQKTVWELIDGERTVHEIVDRSLLGEFNTAKSLGMLVESGLAEIVGQRKTQTRRASTLPKSRKERVYSRASGIAGAMCLMAGALAGLFSLQFSEVNLHASPRDYPGVAQSNQGLEQVAEIQRAQVTSHVYWYVEGTYPSADELGGEDRVRGQKSSADNAL
jgi:hypothetical protein